MHEFFHRRFKYNMRRFLPNSILYMYLDVLLQYNADVTGGVQ